VIGLVLTMAEDTETTLQRSQSTPEPIFDQTSSKDTLSSSGNYLIPVY